MTEKKQSKRGASAISSTEECHAPSVDKQVPSMIKHFDKSISISSGGGDSCSSKIRPAGTSSPKLSFEVEISKLFKNFSNKCFRFDAMKELMRLVPEDDERLQVSDVCFMRGADQLVTACKEVDINVRTSYLRLFRCLFLGVDDQYEQEAMRYLFGLEFFQRAVPNLRDYYQNFDDELHELLIGLAKKDPSKEKDLSRQLAFLMMISPEVAIRLVLLHCFDVDSELVHVVIELFLRMPALLDARIRVPESRFPSTEPRELLIFSLFRRLMTEHVVILTKKENWDILRTVMGAFTRTDFKEPENIFDRRIPISKPVIDATEFIACFIMAHLGRGEFTAFLLGVLSNMLDEPPGMRWEVKWSGSSVGDAGQNLFVEPRALLSLLVYTFLDKSGGGETADVSIVSITLQKLAQLLNRKGIRLPNFEFLEDKLQSVDWCMRYCIYKWISPCVDHYELEVPLSLHAALLPSPEKSCIVPLGTSIKDHMLEEDFLHSILQLGLVSVEEALKLVSDGVLPKPSKEVMPMLAKALLQSIRASTSSDALNMLVPLINCLCLSLDVPIKLYFVSNWIQNCYEGLRTTAHVQILAEALRIEIVGRTSDKSEPTKKVTLRSTGQVVLLSFCWCVEKFLESEVFKDADIGVCNAADSSPQEVINLLTLQNQLSVVSSAINFFLGKLKEPPFQLLDVRQKMDTAVKPIMSLLHRGQFVKKDDLKAKVLSGLKNVPVNVVKKVDVPVSPKASPEKQKPKREPRMGVHEYDGIVDWLNSKTGDKSGSTGVWGRYFNRRRY